MAKSDEAVDFYIKYYTQTTEGKWKWFPAPPDEDHWVRVRFDPGESTKVEHDDYIIKANRLRIWAKNVEGTKIWEQHRRQDLVLVPSDGIQQYVMPVYDHVIQ